MAGGAHQGIALGACTGGQDGGMHRRVYAVGNGGGSNGDYTLASGSLGIDDGDHDAYFAIGDVSGDYSVAIDDVPLFATVLLDPELRIGRRTLRGRLQ